MTILRTSRKQFLTIAATAVAGGPTLAAATARGPGTPAPRRLTHRGVAYEVADGATPQTGWDATRMRGDLAAIAGPLGADAVSVFGTGVGRLTATAEAAAARGLHVWLQPRLGDVPRKEILDHLGEAGLQAERLRAQGASVDLCVGAEFVLFVPGLAPGADPVERVHNLLAGKFDGERLQPRLRAFISDAAKVGRSSFRGRLSYAAAEDDVVDWTPFDVVGIDYYSTFPTRAQHVRALRRHARPGKPLAIFEFGTCTYAGAAARGGLAWDALAPDGKGPKRGLVRSERAQARHIVHALRIFESLGLDSATTYQFVTPDAPHRRDPRRDLDMVSYSVAKPIWGSADRPTTTWRWEPKEAFGALAREFRRARDGRVRRRSRALRGPDRVRPPDHDRGGDPWVLTRSSATTRCVRLPPPASPSRTSTASAP